MADLEQRFGLHWCGRDGAIESARTPAVTALEPVYSGQAQGGHAIFDGDNLEVMKHLLSSGLRGKVKLVYIDPPYNTGKSFVYNDNFRMSPRDYREASGQEARAVETQGRRHARWLSMMYPRLVLARELMRGDASIFVSIDDGEVHHLRLLMDEIFGAEHFVANITWRRKKETASDSRGFATKAEYILCYRRSAETRFHNLPLSEAYVKKAYKAPCPTYPDGPWRPVPITASKGHQGGGYDYAVTTPSGRVVDRKWLCPRKTYDRYVETGRLYCGAKGDAIPQRVMYAHESRGVPPDNLWVDLATNKEGKKTLVEIFGEALYDTPKPVGLLRRILHIATRADEGALVLDFFAGSGTTGHAVMEANGEDGGDRRFILVQRPEATGHPSFETISAICLERVRRVAARLSRQTPLRHHRLVEGLGEVD